MRPVPHSDRRPDPSDPDAALMAMEAELAGLLVDYETLTAVLPTIDRATRRWEMGRRGADGLNRIGEGSP